METPQTSSGAFENKANLSKGARVCSLYRAFPYGRKQKEKTGWIALQMTQKAARLLSGSVKRPLKTGHILRRNAFYQNLGKY